MYTFWLMIWWLNRTYWPRDALIVPLIDCLTSFFSGFVIFTVLGAMAKAKGVEVADVAQGGEIVLLNLKEFSCKSSCLIWFIQIFLQLVNKVLIFLPGTGLAFIVYPEAISQMPAPTVWAILFFFMMLIIGFSSEVRKQTVYNFFSSCTIIGEQSIN